jgi:hypothetical protein
MGKIVNLRQARKRKAREATETTAVTNRSLHGVSLQFDGRRLDPKKKD